MGLLRWAEEQQKKMDAQAKGETYTPPAELQSDCVQWEYRVLNTGWAKDTQATKLENTLNKLGRDGWELVAVCNNPETSLMSKHVTQYLLKRPRR